MIVIDEPAPTESLDAHVSRLLNESRAAHLAYRMAQRNHDTTAVNVAFQKAASLRADAHVLDPQKTVEAWTAEPEKYQHDELLTFYVEAMAR